MIRSSAAATFLIGFAVWIAGCSKGDPTSAPPPKDGNPAPPSTPATGARRVVGVWEGANDRTTFRFEFRADGTVVETSGGHTAAPNRWEFVNEQGNEVTVRIVELQGGREVGSYTTALQFAGADRFTATFNFTPTLTYKRR